MSHLFCFGLGFTGSTLGKSLLRDAWRVSGTTRDPEKLEVLEQVGFKVYAFPGEKCVIEDQFSSVTHLIVMIPPQEEGDIVFQEYRDTISRMSRLEWFGYLSSTGVYGNRFGDWVDETSDLSPSNERNRLRVKVEKQWLEWGKELKFGVHIFRPAGIYGLGRSMLETVKLGKARRINKKGQISGRIHVDDLVSILKASIAKPNPGSIYNVCDDESVPSKEVVEFACQLLKIDPPPIIPFNQAELSEMARTFYLDNKKVCNNKIKKELRVELKYPNYRDGLNAIFQIMSLDV